MTHQFNILVEKDPDGHFVASVPMLPGCHTQARSLDELMVRVRASKRPLSLGGLSAVRGGDTGGDRWVVSRSGARGGG